jgi:hypothetical protein
LSPLPSPNSTRGLQPASRPCDAHTRIWPHQIKDSSGNLQRARRPMLPQTSKNIFKVRKKEQMWHKCTASSCYTDESVHTIFRTTQDMGIRWCQRAVHLDRLLLVPWAPARTHPFAKYRLTHASVCVHITSPSPREEIIAWSKCALATSSVFHAFLSVLL